MPATSGFFPEDETHATQDDTPSDPGNVTTCDDTEAFRIRYRAERGRVITHPEMAARLDTHRLAVDSGEHLAAVEAVHASARADGLATRRAFFMALYSRVHIDGLVVRRTHEQIAEDMAPFLDREVSARTVAGLAREAHGKGLMVTLEGGLSPAAHAKRGGTGARVPLYALTVPQAVEGQLPHRTPHGKGRARRVVVAVHELAYLPRPAVSPENPPAEETTRPVDGPSHAAPVDEVPYPNLGFSKRVVTPGPTGRRDAAGPGRQAPRSRRGETSTSNTTTPTTPSSTGTAAATGDSASSGEGTSKATRLAAVLTDHPTLRKITGERLARLLRPFARAGWSPADIRHALEHGPDGTPHRHSDTVRRPWSWASYRLGLWAPDGQPVTSRSQRSVPAWSWSGERPALPAESWEAEQTTGGLPRGVHQPGDAYRATRALMTSQAAQRRAQLPQTPARHSHVPRGFEPPPASPLDALAARLSGRS